MSPFPVCGTNHSHGRRPIVNRNCNAQWNSYPIEQKIEICIEISALTRHTLKRIYCMTVNTGLIVWFVHLWSENATNLNYPHLKKNIDERYLLHKSTDRDWVLIWISRGWFLHPVTSVKCSVPVFKGKITILRTTS